MPNAATHSHTADNVQIGRYVACGGVRKLAGTFLDGLVWAAGAAITAGVFLWVDHLWRR